MHVGNSRCSELRGFSEGGYYIGPEGAMAGGNTTFLVNVLIRPLFPCENAEVIAENADGTGGWSLQRDTDNSVNTPGDQCVRFIANVYGTGGGGTLTTSIYVPYAQAIGKILMLTLAVDTTETTAIDLYLNGGRASHQASGLTPVASTGALTLGAASTGNTPSRSTAIIALSYGANFTYTNAPLWLTDTYVDALKICDIAPVSGGFEWSNVYSARKLAGFAGKNGASYPRTLVNLGTGDAAASLTKTQQPEETTALVVGNPQAVWASPFAEYNWSPLQ